MTFRPAPKPAPREKAPRTKLPAVSERHDPDFWPRRRREVLEAQDGLCASCGREATDCAHVVPLGMQAARYSPHPLNEMSNLIGLCRNCHRHFDSQAKPWRRAKAAELRARMEALPGHGARRTGGIR